MIEGLELTEVAGGTRLRLRVRPGARKNAVVGAHGGALKISVTAPPERGKANDAVLDLLAKALSLPRGSIEILAGHASPDKVALVPLTAARVAELLGAAP